MCEIHGAFLGIRVASNDEQVASSFEDEVKRVVGLGGEIQGTVALAGWICLYWYIYFDRRIDLGVCEHD